MAYNEDWSQNAVALCLQAFQRKISEEALQKTALKKQESNASVSGGSYSFFMQASHSFSPTLR